MSQKRKSSLTKRFFFIIALWIMLAGCQSPPALEAAPTPEPTATENNEVAHPVATGEGLPTIDDFETASLPAGQAGSASVGFLTWSDGSEVVIEEVAVEPGSPLARPGQEEFNTVLRLDTVIGPGGWAGFSHAFSNAAEDEWLTQDWYPYAGFSAWIYGNETGGTIFIDILDNRNEGSTADDAERWTYAFADDFSGWKFFEIPFEEFKRKDISNGAPNDGLTLHEIHGYAIGTLGTIAMGAQSIYIDQPSVYGVAPDRPVEISLQKTLYVPKEGGRASVGIQINKPSDEPITVYYATNRGQAEPGVDFVLPGEMLTIEAGAITQKFVIEIPDDQIPEGTEDTILYLYNPSGAVLNPQSRAILRIRDNEAPDANIIQDFKIFPPFSTDGMTIAPIAIEIDSALALPEQLHTEKILALNYDAAQPAALQRKYSGAQDWSASKGIQFWYYGTNSGNEIAVDLFNNRSTSTKDVAPADWALNWREEFDTPAGTPPNPAIWKHEIGDGFLNGLNGWGNNELEYYDDSPETVSTDGEGNLVIRVKESDGSLSCYYGPCEYTSARLITWGQYEFTYGRIEARIKIPFGQGLWPAFWLLGNDLAEVDWPQSGEIDIMENIGREPGTVHGTVHGPGYSGGEGMGGAYEFSDGNVSDDFHLYALEWTPDEMRWYFDEVNYYSITPDDIPAGTEWVYDHPFFIILNAAAGGLWPGNPDATTSFPQTMEIDYVRVYGAEDSTERFEYSFTDDFEGWQLITAPFDSFSRSTDQLANAPDDGLGLESIWGYGLRINGTTGMETYLGKLFLVSSGIE